MDTTFSPSAAMSGDNRTPVKARRRRFAVHVLTRAAFALTFTTLAFQSAGCNILGWGSYAIAGPETIKALYILPRQPTLVLAENFGDSTETVIDGGQFEESVSNEISAAYLKKDKSKGAFPFVDPATARNIPTTRPLVYAKMTIPQVAREVGAKQVIYINMGAIEAAFAQGSEMGRGRGSARIKVVDAATGETLWPLDAAAGFPIVYQTPLTKLGDGVNAATIAREVRIGLAQTAAKLFYDFKPE